MVVDGRRSVTILAVSAVAGLTAVAGSGGAMAGTRATGIPHAAMSGRWGTAIEVPGTAALNRGGNAQIISVSCGSAGNRRAGGVFSHNSCGLQGLGGRETHGNLHTAPEGARPSAPQPGRGPPPPVAGPRPES